MIKKYLLRKTLVAAVLAAALTISSLSGCGQASGISGSSDASISTKMSAPPSGSHPSGGYGGPGSSSAKDISYTGAVTFLSDTTETEKTYASSADSQQSLLASGGTSTITGATITKTGTADGDEADFYGTNAAVLSYNGAVLNIEGGSVKTDGTHANAVFAYGTGTINISDTTVETSSDCSGGIMVTGGGTLTADNLTVETQGRSSAAIRSDRGGGTMTVNGGTFTTNGVGSPAVYSTADIKIKDATLISNVSEGLIVEGKNSISIDNCTVEDTNTKLNSNSGTYKNIFLYQSMSGDADEGTAGFSANNSRITTNKGDTIFVTNTSAKVYLENNTIVNNDGDFLRIEAGKWGTEGKNGGTVTLEMVNQKVEGSIIVDAISSLEISLKNGSELTGAIDTDNQAKSIKLTLSTDSVLNLTADTYVDSLENELSDNSNIHLNGHKLYVNGKEMSVG